MIHRIASFIYLYLAATSVFMIKIVDGVMCDSLADRRGGGRQGPRGRIQGIEREGMFCRRLFGVFLEEDV